MTFIQKTAFTRHTHNREEESNLAKHLDDGLMKNKRLQVMTEVHHYYAFMSMIQLICLV